MPQKLTKTQKFRESQLALKNKIWSFARFLKLSFTSTVRNVTICSNFIIFADSRHVKYLSDRSQEERGRWWGRNVYEWICGVIYGMQKGGAEWKNTLAYRLTTEMGFREVKNMESVYYQPEHKVTIPCHVDDPLVKSASSSGRIWFHKTWFCFGSDYQ